MFKSRLKTNVFKWCSSTELCCAYIQFSELFCLSLNFKDLKLKFPSHPLRFHERRCSSRLLGSRPGHHAVPPLHQDFHPGHFQAPLQGLRTGRVRPLLHTNPACALARLGPPSQSLWQLPRSHGQPVTRLQPGALCELHAAPVSWSKTELSAGTATLKGPRLCHETLK